MNFRLKSGLTLHYRTRGSGQTILLMHPVGLQLAFWDDVVALLEDEFRLIAVDTRGHGGSEATAEAFTLEELAADMIELIEGVGGQGKVVFAGCSMGGMIAQAIAIVAPERVAGVVVANASHMRSDTSRATMTARAETAEKGMPTLLETTLSRWFDELTALEMPDKVARTRDWLLEADPVIHSHSWRAIRDLNFGDRLSEVEVPALIVAGTRDASTPVTAVRTVAESLANARFSEIDAGHLCPFEQPEAFAALLGEFAGGIQKQ